MLLLKNSLWAAGIVMLIFAAAVVAYDIYLAEEYRRLLARGVTEKPAPRPIRWKTAGKLGALAIVAVLFGKSIAVVPSGSAGVRIRQTSGTRPGTLYPGVHFINPFLDRVALYDTRNQDFTTTSAEEPGKKAEVLKVQAKEGLVIGLAVTVRYRLDPKRLDYIHDNLPQPIDQELVRPIVMSIFREVVPNYTVREVFATKREEVRQRAADTISKKLSAESVLVKEIMLRDIQLPVEYAKGLEGLLLKEQENDRMATETEIQAKRVRISELQAEAAKVQEIKRAEGDAHVRVLQAKGEADAMQYTLPLKEKQIQQTRLESEARKEATLKNAEAAAQAKVIDSKAELERRKYLADAEANRIRVTSAADAERLRSEAVVLKQNPLLINKIIAEKLSDKLQIMMVPTDGKFFLTNDVLRGAGPTSNTSGPPDDSDDPPAKPAGRR